MNAPSSNRFLLVLQRLISPSAPSADRGCALTILILPTSLNPSPTHPHHLTIQVAQQPTPMQSKSTTGLNRTAAGLVGQQCEPWRHQLLSQEDLDILASSCSRLHNGEAVGRPWCSWLDFYTSARLPRLQWWCPQGDLPPFIFLVCYRKPLPSGAAERNGVDSEDHRPSLTIFDLKVSGNLEMEGLDPCGMPT